MNGHNNPSDLSHKEVHAFSLRTPWLVHGSSKGSSDEFSLLWGHMGHVPVLQKGTVLYEVVSRWTYSEQLSKNVTPIHSNSFWQMVSL